MNIVICNTCEGTGKVEWETNALKTEYIKCMSCNGTGKQIKKKYILKIPYTENLSIFYKTDKEILNLIRNARKN